MGKKDMTEPIQVAASVLSLVKASVTVGKFLKEVKDADGTALELYGRVNRLKDVLENVYSILSSRESTELPLQSIGDGAILKRLDDNVTATKSFFDDLESQFKGFGTDGNAHLALVQRFKLAFKNNSLQKRQQDLETRIQILQADLSMLQVFDASKNHGETQHALENLAIQVQVIDKRLRSIQHHRRNSHEQVEEGTSLHTDEGFVDDDAISILTDCLANATNVIERYTEGAPSVRLPPQYVSSNDGTLTPRSEATPEPIRPISLCTLQDQSVEWPLEVLNKFIIKYCEKGKAEIEREHYDEAENCLQNAILHSKSRERVYSVPFENHADLGEQLILVYQKQGKWAEGISKAHELLRESGSSADQHSRLAEARQNQLLASIYLDKHHRQRSNSPSEVSENLDQARKHAGTALCRLDGLDGVNQQRDECLQLLVGISVTSGKLPEADAFREMLTGESLPVLHEPKEVHGNGTEATDTLENQHRLMFEAIENNDLEFLQDMTSSATIDVDKLYGSHHKRTLLMHAVLKNKEDIVHHLLSSFPGASVDIRDERGQTALHMAASLGHRKIAQQLIHHHADKEAKDWNKETPLFKAVKSNHLSVVQYLCNVGANMYDKDAKKHSVLHYSVQLKTTNMTKWLLQNGCRLMDAKDVAGQTALHFCAKFDQLDQAVALLENAVPAEGHTKEEYVNVQDNNSRTPLFLVARELPTPSRTDMVRLFLDYGAKPDTSQVPLCMKEYEALRPYLPTANSDSAIPARIEVKKFNIFNRRKNVEKPSEGVSVTAEV